MSFLDSTQRRAALLILLLGAGMAMALAPFGSGLIGGLVLYVVFHPVQVWLLRRLPPRVAAGIVVLLAFLLLVIPTAIFAGLVLDQAKSIGTGVIHGPLFDRIAGLELAGYPIGPRLVGLGEELVKWLGASAFGLLGTATRIGLNLTISLFIVYYLLLRGHNAWEAVRPYIPFSPASADLLRDRFRDVTISTVIGTGMVALIQGGIVAAGFWATGLSNAFFWGLVTVVLAILPIVGSGLVWGPGAINLFLAGSYGAAFGMVLIGVVLVGNVDVFVRPAIFRRYAQIHPLVTLIGAIGGVSYFGLLGILIGPLAISYFFELLRMYELEYLGRAEAAIPVPVPLASLEPPSASA